jgi:hypothetical protein
MGPSSAEADVAFSLAVVLHRRRGGTIDILHIWSYLYLILENTMSQGLHYPATRFEPSALIDLANPAERERLSVGAVRAFFNIIEKWKVRDEDARVLLGGVSNGTFYAMKKPTARTLDQDTLTRISYLVGIYKALHVLYGDALADRWVQMPNKNGIFSGGTPLDYMMRGGLLAFQTVRRLLDARRGGT